MRQGIATNLPKITFNFGDSYLLILFSHRENTPDYVLVNDARSSGTHFMIKFRTTIQKQLTPSLDNVV